MGAGPDFLGGEGQSWQGEGLRRCLGKAGRAIKTWQRIRREHHGSRCELGGPIPAWHGPPAPPGAAAAPSEGHPGCRDPLAAGCGSLQ